MLILPRLLRRLVKYGTVTVTGPDGAVQRFGGGGPGPDIAIRVTDPHLDRKMLLSPQLAIAEAWMDGGLDITEGGLRGMLELYQINEAARTISAAEAGWRRVIRMARRFVTANNPIRSRQNAAHHYDIGNDLYRLFLDQDMQYSCGYFPEGDETLDQAQQAKKRHIAAKLRLEPGQRVLDIGSGWGGMAIYLAQMADVEVLGVTLAEEQLRLARERAEAAGLADRVRFELLDYRKVEGKFDRIVSVGMMEHVGAGQLDTFFRTVAGLLAPDGLALIHSVMTRLPSSHTDPFTQKYVFPGGYVPTVSETLAAIARSRLWLLDLECWRKHYGFTLGHWHKRFMANRDKARAMYDERFCRMWELYLLGFESSFLTGPLAVMQLQLGHKRDAAPLARGYIGDETQRLKTREAALATAENLD
jgi:cyclopropane-fatty-acyl-phospholipid synthase